MDHGRVADHFPVSVMSSNTNDDAQLKKTEQTIGKPPVTDHNRASNINDSEEYLRIASDVSRL